MPKLSEFGQSKFLKKEDVGTGMLLTIKGFRAENVAMEGEAPDKKQVLHFVEDMKPMVCNKTNAQTIADIFGLTEDDDLNVARGKKIIVYNDPSIMMGGKRTGGIRIRGEQVQRQAPPPPRQAPQRQAPAPVGNAEFDEGAGFGPDDAPLPDFEPVF